MRLVRRALAIVCLSIGTVSLLPGPAGGQDLEGASGAVIEVPVTGVVDPFVADHVAGVIEEAEAEGANAVLLLIDTQGGLGSATDEVTEAIVNARVPVIGYVAPEGAAAASAGTFVLLASPVAAMAPTTSVGPASPVGFSGAIDRGDTTDDAVAEIRALADAHGRNADWAESAVRDSETATAEEALELDVIDLIAPDVATLLDEIDGDTVALADGDEVTLDVAGAPIVEEGLGAFSGFLHALLDPNLAFVFFWAGLALIAIEFFVPGGIAGTIGALMLVASLAALGMLPVQIIGVVLLASSIVFFVVEVMHPGVGWPSIAGAICILLGGWFLFDTTGSDVRVSPVVIVPVAALALLFFLVVVRAAMRLRHRKVITRDEVLVGREGVVVSDLEPRGVVQVAAEEWTADAIRGTPRRGDRIRVVEMDGLRLKVEPVEEPVSSEAGAAGGRSTT